ncbi:MAG: GDP-mannose 4,6-dehydratase [Armatimonadota bacterium]|nr:GDP-mannose 4,6-dehydratase [Armatimonadota bacterium]MDR7559066.1 GDP-mannose 4,6-dehydratase [Armatimonadota bacterium]
MRCLVTGCEGFLGSHLADLLVEKDLSVCGMVYADAASLRHLEHRMTTLSCDLRDRHQVRAIIDQTRPEMVFHLAAQSFVSVSWEDPEETLRTNVFGTFYLLESLKDLGLNPTTLIVGSSSMYGPSTQEEMPLGEDTAFRPTSIYAVSKAAEDLLGYFYGKVYGMRIIRIRPFNMTGPRKVGDACSDFAKGIAEVELGRRAVLEVGNLATTRDFTDGRDAARALWTLAERGVPGETYNLCSGKAYTMRQVLELLIRLAGRSVDYRIDPARFRPFDDPIYVGDNSKLRALGWQPEIPFEQTLTDMLDYWRTILREAGTPVPSGD